MLKTVLFAFADNGYCSLRKLEDNCRVNMRYMYLMNWKTPSYRTFGYFINEVLAESVSISYGGEVLTAEKIECSKLSMAVYFADYVDSTTGILSAFRVFDADGAPIPCQWSFIADQTDDSCMIWTRFDEPMEPERICKLTFNGETVFAR